MLRFEYEGQQYQADTQTYRLSDCGEFWLVQADIVSSTLGMVMEEVIIPFDDGEADDLEDQEEMLNLRELNQWMEEYTGEGFDYSPEEMTSSSSEETLRRAREIIARYL